MKKITLLLLFLTLTALSQNTKNQIDWRDLDGNKGASFYEVRNTFRTFWINKTKEKGQGWKQYKRWENYMAPRVYPSGNMALPSSNYENFIAWQKDNNFQESQIASRTTGNWTTLNSDTPPTGYDVGSGRINFVVFDPISPTTTMYVGAPDGGLWKTTDGGTTWSTNTDFLPVIGCSGLVIDPTDSQKMFLLTGERETDRRSIGVLKSTDGGATWNPTSLVWTALDNYKTSKIVMDPNDPSIMMIATDGGVFKTDDAWDSWTQVGEVEIISDIEFKPGNSQTVYSSANNKIFKSTDNGDTWIQITSGLPSEGLISRIELAIAPSNDAYVYAILGDQNSGFLGMYRSTNSGTNFSLRSNTPNILHASANPGAGDTGGQAFHDLAIAVKPDDEEIVTIGGINQWQSTNGGASWTRITYWLGADSEYPSQNSEPEPYIHADIQYIAYQPGSNSTFFSTCDGGISKTTDNGVTWADITNNINVGQQTNIALSETNANFLFTGLQDIGSLKYNTGVWSGLSGGDGEDGFIDRTNNDNVISSTVEGEFFISYDGGITYNDVTGLPSGGEWFSPIHQDPIDAGTVYVGGFPNLRRSTDVLSGNAYSWTTLGSPVGAGNILRFEIAPSNNNVMYAIKENTISRSANAGSNWSNITGSLPVGSATLKNLVVSNTDADKLWVVFSGYSASNKVYRSNNGGVSWTNVSTGLPNIPMNAIVYTNDSANDALYVAADIGVYYLDNTLTTWEPFLTNLPNVAVQDLEIFYPTGKLRAATYGRGSWESPLRANSETCANTTEWIGGAWSNGIPDVTMAAIIAEAYDTATPGLGNITACELIINADVTLIISDGHFVSVENNITINGILQVSNEGSLVQVTEDAITINNGAISLSKTTPILDDRNFIVMSSPVTAEARDRVYGNSRAVFSIIPENFVPFDLSGFPEYADAENFLDDDNDYLLLVTGSSPLPAAGIGQLIFPQPAPNVGNGSYTLTYTQDVMNPGTLNSGTITIPINYNGPATLNNYNLLGNPYASAIDVTAFINANDAVDAVYYWDHLTNPNAELPGPGTSDFSMNDISIRNAMMGTAAVNGGTPPTQFMSSGQGFAIKASQDEAVSNTPVVFTNSIRVPENNDGFRSSENLSTNIFDKLWLSMTTSSYTNAKSQMAIGFKDGATLGYDVGYDTFRLGTFISLFSTLETEEQLSIQGREAFDTQMEIPVGFSTSIETQEEYVIRIDNFEGNALEESPVFLIDQVLNTITNLKETPYTFIANIGIQPNRFIVVFEETTLSNEDVVNIDTEIIIFPNPASNEIILGYSGSKKLQAATIVNVNGQSVQKLDLSNFNQSQRFTINTLSAGIYFIEIMVENQTIVKKLIVR